MPFTHPAFEGAREAVRREMFSPETVVHPDDAAVDALAVLMKAKLTKQRAKGYGGWDTDCTQQRLSELLRGHVDKGDPVDVANFCAFLSARGEGITSATNPETAQLQARVAELEAALAAEREVHVSVCSASDDELTKARDALRRLEVSANSVAYCYRHRPENFAGALIALEEDAAFAREATGGQP